MLTKEMFEIATRIDDAYVLNLSTTSNYRDTAYTLFEICNCDIDKYEEIFDKLTDYYIPDENIVDWFKCDGDIDKFDALHPEYLD